MADTSAVRADATDIAAELAARAPDILYRLNADFEDHAEHEYALLVQEHPEWETMPYEGSFVDDYGSYDSLADLVSFGMAPALVITEVPISLQWMACVCR